MVMHWVTAGFAFCFATLWCQTGARAQERLRHPRPQAAIRARDENHFPAQIFHVLLLNSKMPSRWE